MIDVTDEHAVRNLVAKAKLSPTTHAWTLVDLNLAEIPFTHPLHHALSEQLTRLGLTAQALSARLVLSQRPQYRRGRRYPRLIAVTVLARLGFTPAKHEVFHLWLLDVSQNYATGYRRKLRRLRLETVAETVAFERLAFGPPTLTGTLAWRAVHYPTLYPH